MNQSDLPPPADQAISITSGRRRDLDILKGIAIALVVFGHLFPAGAGGVAPWYEPTRLAIYAFHMPLFMYVSGYVFALAGSNERFEKSPGQFIVKRADRLLVPMLVFAIVIVCAKALVTRSVKVTDGVTSVGDGLWNVVSNTDPNPAFSLWYLIVLFVYSIATPLLWRAAGRRLAPLLVLALLIAALPLTKHFYIEKISDFYMFFILGALAFQAGDQLTAIFRRWCYVALAILGLFLFLPLPGSAQIVLCSLAAIPAFHGLALRGGHLDNIFDWLGQRVIAIYLMNTIFIGVAVALASRFHMPFGATVVLGFTAGLLGPIVIKEVVDRPPFMKRVAYYLQ
jgi:fucose 4-O-acetylase-like acetyltransferase